ncbi:5'-deoxynucleotidase [Desulfosporosinus hippei]|uniref:5'-deoxynucleotidase n=1 Tax=Desulfosporosinus hippei DSM 8344 TaxID=1121419 RepID=A0A1G8CAD0_9FIRM|nr:5'-deoxynucleotidase [Desulfosporosinus hippei]SDH42424.1 5'-deoxynucleotidase [Desulfosporosinus hippei DSM 8344]
MSHFFAYLSRMKLIQRWGLMRNTRTENIQEHSLQVAMIAHNLAIIRNMMFDGNLNPERVMALAMYHEVSEVITGDLATPIKYFNPEIKNAFGKIEEIARMRLFKMIPEEIRAEYKGYFFPHENDEDCWEIVKASDKISAYLKCVEELKSGNEEFLKAKNKIEQELQSIGLSEVRYFLDKFIPSFSLTLDELN